MAEVTLTLVDPAVYGDVGEPEVDVQDELLGDWDESALRTAAADDAERYIEEIRPGQGEEEEGTNTADLPATAESASPHVVLKIRRRKFKRTFKAGEIAVTRRLFRTGESEYLLNGKLCRLRDIQDLFMGTGLGPESYAIIEQGRIGQILSSKPTDRRAIIEEAAGITKFKTRKRLAEARLEDAKQNLSRINDIFDEVTRQMNSLKRQASKAERYARLRDEMRAKLRVVLASKFAQLDAQAASVDSEIAAISEDMRLKTEAAQQMEAQYSDQQQRGYAVERDAQSNRERLSTLAMELDRAAAGLRTNEERCAELQARSAGAQAEITSTQEQLSRLEQELESNRATLQSANADVESAQTVFQRKQQEAAAAAAALTQLERHQEQRRNQVLAAVSQASSVRNRITQAEERMAALDRDSQRLSSEIAGANQQLETFGGRRGQLGLEFESATQRVNELDARIAETRQKDAELRATEVEGKRHLDSLRAEYAGLMGRRGSLEAVIAEHGYSTESVRRLFKSGALNGGHAPAGVLADFLEVEDRYEPVVEDFLRDELNYIVVKSWDAADEGLRLLRSDVDGRATFLVHPEDSQARFSFVHDETVFQGTTGDSVVPLKNCIRVLNGFGKSLEVILPKLGNGYIVPDSNVGRELALENPDAFFLAQSGECFHNVTVTGGKQRSEGPLSMKRELRDVLRQMAELECAIRDKELQVAALAREIAEVSKLLQRLEDEKRDAEREVMTSGHTLQQLGAEMERARERLATYEGELRRLSAERSEWEAFVTGQAGQLAELEQRQRAIEEELQAAQGSLEDLRLRRDECGQQATDARAQAATLEERRRGAIASVQRLESMTSEISARVAKLVAQIESAAAEIQQREAENARLAERLVEWNAEREASQQRDQELAEELQNIRVSLSQLEEELKVARAELDAARDRRGQLAAEQARLQSDAQHLAETCIQELSTQPEELAADESLARVVGDELITEESAYKEMRARLDGMGPVNMMALEEYKETAERHEFLDTQRKDLLQSIENTQNTIKEIETVSRQKFEEAFVAINENFGRTFRKLFGGGQAFMRLTDQENSAESGLDVVASPPGKKLQNVLLLSGGEKALTAFALLVAIFQYVPSPFCILDEVDAPLDEANIGRFAELVQEMSLQTQFIIITHSKKTMGMAPTLYGVTMQEPGVSKLVSVRMQEETGRLAAAG
jgi:chromosome segregation protein